jgi:hypothetical protein
MPDTTAPDPVAEYLEAVRQRAVSCADFDDFRPSQPPGRPSVFWAAVSAKDVPRLLKAVEAAIKHILSGDDSPQDGIAAITRALLGEVPDGN